VSNPVRSPLGDAMVQASVEAGIPANDDFNGARQEGVGYYQTTTTNRRRWSSARAYLGPARGRRNLTIATDALATRILFDGNRAVGVEYHTPAGRKTARARGEIVVSGGVYGSPQLLQLSGLGPADLLAEHGIPVVREMRGVGAHLHDHFNTYLVWRCTQKITVNDLAMSAAQKVKAAMQYAVNRSGHLSNAGIYAGALVRTDPRLEQPDLQINMSGWSALERLRTGIKPHPFSAFTFSPVHLRPDGRGTVRIKSPDPLMAPAIQFNFLASDYDFQALIYGMQLSRKIAAQPALKPFIGEEVLPGPQCQSEADMIEEIRVRGVSNLHPVGTCRMGREVDAVVDPRLRVDGVEGLRVADASIMPQVPGGNTNAPSIMIGEKCAAMMLEDALAA
jgi:choline dehydrogenase